MSKSKKNMLDGLFSRSAKEDNAEEAVDLQCYLIALADTLSGYDGRIDAEIFKFKKMLKVGSTAEELNRQVQIITQSFDAYQKKVSDNTKDWFKKLPAVDFISGLLQEDLDDGLAKKLRNYQGGLAADILAPMVLHDVIELLEPDHDDHDNSSKGLLDPEEVKLIAAPIVKLLNTIEQEQGQLKHITELLQLASLLKTHEDLCTLLEGVSELIIRSIYSANDHVEHFLKNLRERLEIVDVFISSSNKTQQAMSDASSTLTENMSKEVDDLQLMLTDSKTMEELEQQVKRSLEKITSDLDTFNQQRKTLEAESDKRISELQKQLDEAREETDNLRDNLHQQRQRAMTDPLTKLPNRHAYNERLHLEYNRWRRYNKPLCLVMADIDHFKKINDTYGHSKGDEVLTGCAKVLMDGLRSTDFVGRYGGEEFIILLPETSVKDAIRAMNKLRAAIKAMTFTTESEPFNITMSFGVATFESNDDFNLVFNRADTALYRAKDRGRNQVCAELKKSA